MNGLYTCLLIALLVLKMNLKHVFLCLLLLALLLTPQAAGIKVQTSVIIEGEGVFDFERSADTHVELDGLKYSDWIYTRSLGYWGDSNVNYTSDFSMLSADKLNSTIAVDIGYEITNFKGMACMRNYNLLGRQSYYTDGDAVTVVAFATDNHSMSMDLATETIGMGKYRILVRNESNMHVFTYLDKGELIGNYSLIIGSYIGEDYYPASDIEDFLPCPWGPTFGDCKTEEP